MSTLNSPTQSQNDSRYLTKWLPNKNYSTGDLIMGTGGKVLRATTTFTSGSVFDPANWTDTYASTTVATDGTIANVVRLTQSQYNALPTKVASTMYVIVG